NRASPIINTLHDRRAQPATALVGSISGSYGQLALAARASNIRPKKKPAEGPFPRPASHPRRAGSPPASPNRTAWLHARTGERGVRERRRRVGVAERPRPLAGLDPVELQVLVGVDALRDA